jgi:hypothetical protein
VKKAGKNFPAFRDEHAKIAYFRSMSPAEPAGAFRPVAALGAVAAGSDFRISVCPGALAMPADLRRRASAPT